MDNMGDKWAPQVIKAVYAFILGIITNPIIALLALGSQAEHDLIPLSQSQQDLPVSTVVGDPSSSSPITSPAAPSMARMFSSSSSARPRPPLTANVSTLSRLSNLPAQPPLSPSIAATANSTTLLSPPVPPPSSPMVGRPRAFTASSYNPSLYSLGGTGGRNQRRPRASSRATQGGEEVTFGGSPIAADQAGAGGDVESPTIGGLPVAGRKELPSAWLGAPINPAVEPSSPSPSGLGLGVGGGRLGELQMQEKMEAPRESLEGTRVDSAEFSREEVGEKKAEL